MATAKYPKYDNDTVTLGYLKKALGAEKTETDGKTEQFQKNYSAPPVPPYYKDSILTYNNKVYKCTTNRLIGTFSWSDWQVIATDDTTINNFIENTYSTDKLELQEQIDGKVQTHYQDTDPAILWTTDLEKSKHVGDYWYNTTDNTQWRYCRNTTTPITYNWRQVNVPITIYDMINSKKSIYTSKPISYKKDDMWIIEDTISEEDLPIGTSENPIAKGDWVFALQDSDSYDKSHWLKRDENVDIKYLEDHYYNTETLDTKFETLENNVDSKITKSRDEIELQVEQKYTTKEETKIIVNDYDEQIGTINSTLTTHGTDISNLSVENGRISSAVSSVQESVNSISSDINNNYTSNEELEQILQNQKNTITTEMTTQYQQDMDSFSFDIINKINQDGVTSLKNTMVTIDENGINTAKNNEDVVSLLDNQGVYVSDGKKREDNSNVIMKVDRDGGYLKTLEVKSTIKEQDLIQKEKIDDETYGECQGWYWIGSDI